MEEGKLLIDKLYDEGIWFLKVLGGEPFFRRDTLALFRYAADKGMLLSFSTNASLITEEVAAALSVLHNSIMYIQMSLYGESEETYDKVTGSARNFHRAMKGLGHLLDKGLDVTILTVATEENSHKIPEYYEIARRFGVSEFRLTPKIGLGRAARRVDGETGSTPRIWSKLIASLREIKDSAKEDAPDIWLDARPLLGSYLFKIVEIPNFFEKCSAATTMIYIDPTGQAAPCPFLKQMPEDLKKIYSHIGTENLIEHSFQEVWESEAFCTFRTYYDPKENLFEINEKCRYFRDGVCTPCVVTPCNCAELIQLVKEELDHR